MEGVPRNAALVTNVMSSNRKILAVRQGPSTDGWRAPAHIATQHRKAVRQCARHVPSTHCLDRVQPRGTGRACCFGSLRDGSRQVVRLGHLEATSQPREAITRGRCLCQVVRCRTAACHVLVLRGARLRIGRARARRRSAQCPGHARASVCGHLSFTRNPSTTARSTRPQSDAIQGSAGARYDGELLRWSPRSETWRRGRCCSPICRCYSSADCFSSTSFRSAPKEEREFEMRERPHRGRT
jgi:hypothetical protein